MMPVSFAIFELFLGGSLGIATMLDFGLRVLKDFQDEVGEETVK
jgi:hypothetical protein